MTIYSQSVTHRIIQSDNNYSKPGRTVSLKQANGFNSTGWLSTSGQPYSTHGPLSFVLSKGRKAPLII